MKKIILLALTALVIVGCVEHYEETKINSDYSVRVIDSCEYVERNVYYGTMLVHKGNCRFCKERKEKEMKELVEQLKEK